LVSCPWFSRRDPTSSGLVAPGWGHMAQPRILPAVAKRRENNELSGLQGPLESLVNSQSI
jgi:hypothetical protein